MKAIVVASNNPVKLEAARRGCACVFKNESIEIHGCSVPSGVSDQPMSDRETFQGAWNRATLAMEQHPAADFWLGIEGGLDIWDGEHVAFAWVIVRSKTQIGKAKTAYFFLPPALTKLVNEGHELGIADDILFGRTNSKQDDGTVGALTRGRIDRTTYYEQAVVLALIPFINEELFN